MRELYFLSVWLHILAATVWIGGLFFLMLVIVPWLRSGAREPAMFLRETATRFRTVAWTCFAVLFVTGSYNLWYRGVRLHDLASTDWLFSRGGSPVAAKLAVFLVVVALSARHDFVIGPAASDAMRDHPGAPETERLRRQASLHGRANAVFALVLVFIAVAIVRGWPF